MYGTSGIIGDMQRTSISPLPNHMQIVNFKKSQKGELFNVTDPASERDVAPIQILFSEIVFMQTKN